MPAPAPPPARPDRLVRGPLDAVVTLVLAGLLAWLLWRAARFVFVTGRWEILRINFTNLLVGQFPREALWRPVVALVASMTALAFGAGATRPIPAGTRRRLPSRTGGLAVLEAGWPLLLLIAAMAALVRSPGPLLALAGLSAVAAGAWSAGRRVPRRRARWALLAAAAVLLAAVAVLVAFGSPGWDDMGGLLLTLWLALGGILLSFPAGVLLALGRRSSLPAVRVVSTAYIELMRGVPLVALLFVGQLVIGFLLPPGAHQLGDVTRAVIVIVLFTAAYVAEIVRGGLQSVPRGQVDAALAVGLSPIAAARIVVLPQALRAVIPPLVGQFISLFKDTALVTTVGLFDVLGVAQSITNQPAFVGQNLQAETLSFASLIFWVAAYSMSRAGRRLEIRMGVGKR
jgi:general L-amino acid transport system permease protein